MFLTGLIIGLIIGANIGLVFAGMLAASARQERLVIQNPRSGNCR